jgi:hypothetical protein
MQEHWAAARDRDVTMVSVDPFLSDAAGDRNLARSPLTTDNCPRLKELEARFQEAARSGLDYGCQIELANLMVCLTNIQSEGRTDLLPQVELALAALSNSSRNIIVAQRVIWHLESSRGTAPRIRAVRWLRTNSPPANVMLGLLCHFLLGALFVLITLSLVTVYLGLSSAYLEWSGAAMLPADASQLASRPSASSGELMSPVVSTLLVVVLSAMSGSIVSVMARINAFTTAVTVSPFVLFLTGLLKPGIGIASAIFMYAVLNTGFIPLQIPPDKTIAAWAAIAFVVGFSERLAPDVVGKSAATRGAAEESGQHSEASAHLPAPS